MHGVIGIDHHKIECIIGDLPEERLHTQEIFMDLEIGVDFSICASTDNLENTICYVKIANACTAIAQENKFQLIETLVCAIVDQLLKDQRIEWAWVRIKKPAPFISAKYCYVELRKEK